MLVRVALNAEVAGNAWKLARSGIRHDGDGQLRFAKMAGFLITDIGWMVRGAVRNVSKRRKTMQR
jgi:hypothetical protein